VENVAKSFFQEKTGQRPLHSKNRGQGLERNFVEKFHSPVFFFPGIFFFEKFIGVFLHQKYFLFLFFLTP
jgi:hypothetical protein